MSCRGGSVEVTVRPASSHKVTGSGIGRIRPGTTGDPLFTLSSFKNPGYDPRKSRKGLTRSRRRSSQELTADGGNDVANAPGIHTRYRGADLAHQSGFDAKSETQDELHGNVGTTWSHQVRHPVWLPKTRYDCPHWRPSLQQRPKMSPR